jgi:hypothetical protein
MVPTQGIGIAAVLLAFFLSAPTVQCWKQQYLQLGVSGRCSQGHRARLVGRKTTGVTEGLSWTMTSNTESEPVINDGMG